MLMMKRGPSRSRRESGRGRRGGGAGQEAEEEEEEEEGKMSGFEQHYLLKGAKRMRAASLTRHAVGPS